MTPRSDALATPDAPAAASVRRLPAAALAALVIAAVCAATLLGAVFFETVVGVPPCPLCTQQRIPHMIALPVALLVAAAAWRRAPRALVVGGLVVLLVLPLVSGGIGAYHAGIEWGFWRGPGDCTGEIAPFGNAGSLLTQMQQTSVIRCDVVSWRFLGLSLAGWNVVISTALAGVALAGLVQTVRRGA
jgi:disulfide bond formation protein DsbB